MRDTAHPGSALGVTRSLTGRNWALTETDARLAAALSQRHGLPEIVARILAARGVGLDAVESFLDPQLRRLLPDPCRLKDMRAGAERIARAIDAGETIAVFGDYDVDGATAAALLLRFFAAVGSSAVLYVPDRLREGYGPNAEAMVSLAGRGVSVVVTVDCGIGAHAALDAAAEAGLDVIVVDHHLPTGALPRAVAVIDPKRPDECGSFAHLAAVGVAFLLVVDINRLLRDAGFYRHRPEPDLRQWLDLVALGTVCDMVPLDGVNRAFVVQGLKIMARRGNPGLRALSDAAGLARSPRAADLGFLLGPRINAGGRVGEADLGARLLSTDDPALAASLARHLDALNRERQAIEQTVAASAIASVEERHGADSPLVAAVGEGWHPGVVGIVASRLVERFLRPAVVVSLDGERAVASARSVPGVDFGSAVAAAAEAGLLVKGGGHAMAAGFTCERRRLEDVLAFLDARLVAGSADDPSAGRLSVDGVLTLSGAAALPPVVLSSLAPFGPGHPEPRFAVEGVRIASLRCVGGGRHLGCALADADGGRLQGIAFRCSDTALGRGLSAHAGAPFHVAGRLQVRDDGRMQLVIDDAALAFG